jgi:hypothetical protein
MRKLLTLAVASLLAVFTLAACGEDEDKEALNKDCPAAPAAMTGSHALPGNFPAPADMVFVSVQKDGPTTIAKGYVNGDISDAHDAVSNAVKGASGYEVTKEEQDEADSEVNFSGAGNSGQVKMNQTCRDRTDVKITIRPA